jgi:hypothetical protein
VNVIGPVPSPPFMTDEESTAKLPAGTDAGLVDVVTPTFWLKLMVADAFSV